VHRDLKASNILVSKSGVNCSISDWLGWLLVRGDPTLTRAGTVMETPDYVAPHGRQASEKWRRSLSPIMRPQSALARSDPRLLSKTGPGGPWLGLEGLAATCQMAVSEQFLVRPIPKSGSSAGTGR
jgi:hypothetical protein